MLTLLSVANSPYPRPQTFYTIPALRWELRPFNSALFFGGEASSRCEPARLNRLNPVTGLWDAHMGFRVGSIEATIGHVSEHGIDEVQKATESKDYLEMKYRVEF